MSHKELSSITGIGRAVIADFAAGNRNIHSQNLDLLCEALGLSLVKTTDTEGLDQVTESNQLRE